MDGSLLATGILRRNNSLFMSVRPGKVDLQFIIRKMHAARRTFFIISFGPVHVATETII